MKKVIIITGGSDGLGKSIAERLAQNEENDVVILSNQEDKLTDAAIETNSDYQLCDVTDSKSVETAVQVILQKKKKIDVLINNAGVWLAGDLTECSYDVINNCIDVNTKGPIYMTKAVLPSMYKNKKRITIP